MINRINNIIYFQIKHIFKLSDGAFYTNDTNHYDIALDKAAYCVFTQFRGPENAIKLISVRTKKQ